MVENNVNNVVENGNRFELVLDEQDSSYWFVVCFTQIDESQTKPLIEGISKRYNKMISHKNSSFQCTN